MSGGAVPGELDRRRLERLLEVGQGLVSELDVETVLAEVLDAARELTGAAYAALGILDEEEAELERFLFVGIDEQARQRIGPLPRGHGILGELIRRPEPLRLERIADHPRSYGFPAGHPPMRSFLGVPVMIRDSVFGNLYLTDKAGGQPFGAEDESLLITLSRWAAIAIENARLYEGAQERRRDLERAVRGLEATVSLSRELGPDVELERVLELIAKRGRALVDARALIVLLEREGGLQVAETAGEAPGEIIGTAVEVDGVLQELIEADSARRFSGPGVPLLRELGLAAGSLLVVPLRERGRRRGVICAVERIGSEGFSADDELVLTSFGSTAAAAVGATLALESERLELSIAASERERGRWARELHDETLQELGALKVMQQAALNSQDPDRMRTALEGASERVERAISGLEGLITELRPAALDKLGVAAAIDALIADVQSRQQLRVASEINLADEAGAGGRPAPELEATIYRIVQEALNNVVKHAAATRASVSIGERDREITVIVEDDGRGLDGGGKGGFGLIGMRERVTLAGGRLTIGTGEQGGVRVSATLPARPDPTSARAPGVG